MLHLQKQPLPKYVKFLAKHGVPRKPELSELFYTELKLKLEDVLFNLEEMSQKANQK